MCLFISIPDSCNLAIGLGTKINVRSLLFDFQDPTICYLVSDGFDACFPCGSNFLFAFDIDMLIQASNADELCTVQLLFFIMHLF